MDSRIREIEQWVAEAKEDLGECGQEAYIRKLYLLDAEIRAIIRENGILPGVTSPEPQQQRHVRRFTVPALAVSGVLSVLLLAATTFYFMQPLLVGRTATPAQSHQVLAGFVPASIDGELILADTGVPLNMPKERLLADIPLAAQFTTGGTAPAGLETGAGAAPSTVPAVGPVLLASLPSATLQPQTAAPLSEQARAVPLIAPTEGSDGVIDVMLGYLPLPAAPLAPPMVNNQGSAPSVGFDGLVPQVARLEFTDRFTVPESGAERVNSVKTQLTPRSEGAAEDKHASQGVHVDKSTKVSVDNVDNSAGEGEPAEPETKEQGAK